MVYLISKSSTLFAWCHLGSSFPFKIILVNGLEAKAEHSSDWFLLIPSHYHALACLKGLCIFMTLLSSSCGTVIFHISECYCGFLFSLCNFYCLSMQFQTLAQHEVYLLPQSKVSNLYLMEIILLHTFMHNLLRKYAFCV